MANRYAANLRSDGSTTQTRFAFSAADDATAMAIYGILKDHMDHYYTSLQTYLQYTGGSRGQNHTAGNDKSVKIVLVTPTGRWVTYRLRNVRDTAASSDFEDAFTATTAYSEGGVALEVASANIKNLRRGDVVPAEEGNV